MPRSIHMALRWNCVDSGYPVLEWSCLERCLLSLGLFSELHGGAEEQRRSIFWVSGNGPGISYMSLHLLFSPSNLLDCELLCPFYRWEDRSLEWLSSVSPAISKPQNWISDSNTHTLPVASFCFWKCGPPACHGACRAPLSLGTELGFVGFVLLGRGCQGAGWRWCHAGTLWSGVGRPRREGEFSLGLWCLWPEAWGGQGLERVRGLPLCLQWGQLVLCIALVAVSLTTVAHSLSSPFLSFPLVCPCFRRPDFPKPTRG